MTTVLVLHNAATGLNDDVDTTDVREIGVVGVDEGDGDVPDKFVELLVTDDTCWNVSFNEKYLVIFTTKIIL